MPPVIHGIARAMMPTFNDAIVQRNDPIGDKNHPIGIDLQADRPVGKGGEQSLLLTYCRSFDRLCLYVGSSGLIFDAIQHFESKSARGSKNARDSIQKRSKKSQRVPSPSKMFGLILALLKARIAV
jgi:hypothetical protein